MLSRKSAETKTGSPSVLDSDSSHAVEQLCDLVSAYRLVTLTGPGGIGKTVLASEVARRLFPTSESDVFFVELVSLSDPKLVPSTIADTLNLQLQSDAISPESVARTIGGRRFVFARTRRFLRRAEKRYVSTESLPIASRPWRCRHSMWMDRTMFLSTARCSCS